jgi:hypothetical protein
MASSISLSRLEKMAEAFMNRGDTATDENGAS